MLNWCGAVLLHQSNPQQPQYTLVHACTMVVPGVWHRIMQAFDVGGCSGMTQMRSSHYVCARAWACTQASRKHLNKWQFAKLFSRFRDWGTLRIGPADMTSFGPCQSVMMPKKAACQLACSCGKRCPKAAACAFCSCCLCPRAGRLHQSSA